MAKVTLDYDVSEVSSQFEPLPAGQYLAEIVNPDDCQLTESQNGKAMIKIAWTIKEGEYEGRKIFDNVVLSVDWKVKQYCDIAGIESGSELDTEDFIGMEAIVEVVQREYQGEMRNNVKTLLQTS
jgi:hypothetical protein